MRRLLLPLLCLPLLGCTADEPPTAAAPGPCEAAREQPPAGSQEQREQADLDGDGTSDEVVSWVVDGRRVVQAWLATGENAAPEPLFAGELLAAGDADADGRAEVFAATSVPVQGGATSLTGAAYVLDGCRLVPVTGPEGPLTYTWSVGADPRAAAATLACLPGGVLEQAVSRPGPQPGTRRVQTRRWTLSRGTVTAAVDAEGVVPAAEDRALRTDSAVDC